MTMFKPVIRLITEGNGTDGRLLSAALGLGRMLNLRP